MDTGALVPTAEGTPSGRTRSPVLANRARHGLEERSTRALPRQRLTPAVLRDADELVGCHPERQAIEPGQARLAGELHGLGLARQPSQTRIGHTRQAATGVVGCDLLGCHIRPSPVSTTRLGCKTRITPSPPSVPRQQRRRREGMAPHQTARHASWILARHPVIRGWSRACSTRCRQETCKHTARQLLNRVRAWSKRRHPHTSRTTAARQEGPRAGGKGPFSPPTRSLRRRLHREMRIKRHVHVPRHHRLSDGDWGYWSTRRGRPPDASTRVATLLKRPHGPGPRGGLHDRAGDVRAVDHRLPTADGGKEGYDHGPLRHGHGHDAQTAEDRRRST